MKLTLSDYPRHPYKKEEKGTLESFPLNKIKKKIVVSKLSKLTHPIIQNRKPVPKKKKGNVRIVSLNKIIN